MRRSVLKMKRVKGEWRASAFCVWCARVGRVTVASVADHIVSHRGDEALFWDESNLQPMCAKCHGVKSMHERHGIKYPDLTGIG